MPNNDYILRSDALKAILGVSIYDAIEELEGARTIAENTWADGLYDAYKIVEEEVDAADVEPVIRCRDCKNSFMCDPGGIRCTKILNNGKYMPVEGDFFCAYGAKMDTEPPKEKKEKEDGADMAL